MSQSTALATSTGTRALARFGSEEDIKMLILRQASIFGIEPAEVNRPDVQASLIKATQYSITYGYLPGIHVHMMPFNKKVKGRNGQDEWIKSYEPALGEKAWKDSADKSAQVQGFKYLVETQEMTPEEVKRHTAADPTAEYTEGDAGFKARVLRSDHAEIYRMMGRQYDPEWSYGFWRKKAKKNYKGQWISDETPNQRGPRDVAERRAYKSALMKVFSLLPLNEFDEARRFKSLATYVEDETAVDRTLMAPPAALHYDDDGLLLHGESPVDGHYRAVDAGTGEIYDDVPPANPSAEIDFGMGQEEDDGPADAIEKQLDKMHQRFNGQDRPRVDYDADADFDSIPGQGASVTAKYAGLINSLVGPSREHDAVAFRLPPPFAPRGCNSGRSLHNPRFPCCPTARCGRPGVIFRAEHRLRSQESPPVRPPTSPQPVAEASGEGAGEELPEGASGSERRGGRDGVPQGRLRARQGLLDEHHAQEHRRTAQEPPGATPEHAEDGRRLTGESRERPAGVAAIAMWTQWNALTRAPRREPAFRWLPSRVGGVR